MPTDKKFTGQRLDGTGLYYYSARYYDPQIGRFISADTIIPDPANPQSLDRYSYVLNNPLKYVDPSGHRVDIYDPFLDLIYEAEQYGMHSVIPNSMFEDLMALHDAWNKYSEIAPEAANRMENSKGLITIEWADLKGGEGDFNFLGDSDYEILLDTSLITGDSRRTVVVLAHESFHVLVRLGNPILPLTRDEEATAWSYGYWAGKELGYEHEIARRFKNIKPHTSTWQMLPNDEFKSRVNKGIDIFKSLGWYTGLPRANTSTLGSLQTTAFMYWTGRPAYK